MCALSISYVPSKYFAKIANQRSIPHAACHAGTNQDRIYYYFPWNKVRICAGINTQITHTSWSSRQVIFLPITDYQLLITSKFGRKKEVMLHHIQWLSNATVVLMNTQLTVLSMDTIPNASKWSRRALFLKAEETSSIKNIYIHEY